ncbi:DUF6141 family protein [Priestia koreensis]|uniref:Uncharacterized protein n=1 Tax=Priestia koreensis TaxID=284581 RepID=A0A0M0L601_9BACI|nr:DUF6141 family protein [Priestia koreensis]KOO46103.1 hypothetical protein AMD01_09515 [Priestia koreensis]
MSKKANVRYREIQRPRTLLLWVPMLAVALLMWYAFIQQVFFGNKVGTNPASNGTLIVLWVVFGIIFPVVFLGLLKLVTEVRDDGLYIRYVPFHIHYKVFLFSEITSYKPITYSPLKRFGGWGIRFNLQNEIAYNMSGNSGMEIQFQQHTIVIGTRRPDELKKAIDAAYQEK